MGELGMNLDDLIARWESKEGRPYQGRLISREVYNKDPDNIGCMCAQGQVLHLIGGYSVDDLASIDQRKADADTAKLLGISRAQAILLRQINDGRDDAPSVVLTNPAVVVGSEWPRIDRFWRHLDTMTADDWRKVFAARAAAWDAARDAAWDAARAAARDAAWDAAGAAAWALVVRDLIPAEQFDRLYGPWREVIG
jgi:hypothetical protein